ncbi:hypothetical protein H257_05727 [Aphanomyces astaci]|uniref:Uncharacterized protein n=1 Tax=Aphanomyces astaci TaxID=112090 RepID=W4GQI5_APHAT|nr:hypothetical protein H257_05727 [Aphanomyces astaci]ETV81133.1 hypothetical protein H257_05727 [Aphanomyces astaci]|eukprot:XP_009828991.1 hypothetical protein H257_05727 [Aphanomyces astaci]
MDVTVSSSSPPPSPWIEAVDGHGRTPLMHAALAGHWAAVQWMLQHGADPATIQALDLPRTVQRAVAASQHAHVVIHRRYVVQTIIGPQQERHDDEVGEGLAMDLKTGHNVRLVTFASKENLAAYCARVDSVQRRSPWLCGVADWFEDVESYVAVLEGAGRYGAVLDCVRPPAAASTVGPMLCRALADVHSGGFVHTGLVRSLLVSLFSACKNERLKV